MVETISPVVHGGRNRNYWIALGLHAIGAVASAGATGFVLGGIGSLLGAPWGGAGAVAVLALAILYALRDLFSLPIPLPDLKRQVPEWWRSFFSRPATALLYGVGLGFGFYTSLTFGTYVVIAAAAFVAGDPVVGALLCAPFGLGRAVVIAVTDIERIQEGRGQRFLGTANGSVAALLGLYALVGVL